MNVVQRDETLDSLRLSKADQKPDVSAPVMPDQQHARKLERVEQGEDIARKAFLLVPASGRLRPAESP
jgi:hypothetical protein